MKNFSSWPSLRPRRRLRSCFGGYRRTRCDFIAVFLDLLNLDVRYYVPAMEFRIRLFPASSRDLLLNRWTRRHYYLNPFVDYPSSSHLGERARDGTCVPTSRPSPRAPSHGWALSVRPILNTGRERQSSRGRDRGQTLPWVRACADVPSCASSSRACRESDTSHRKGPWDRAWLKALPR